MIKVSIQIDREDLPQLIELLRESSTDTEISVRVNDQSPSAVRTSATTGGTPEALATGAESVLSEEAIEKLRMASPHDRPLLQRFMAQEVQVRGAKDIAGPLSTRYVRLHVPGPYVRGAYCYVKPSYLDFRLPRRYAEGFKFARARDVSDSPYEVRLRPITEESLEEAWQLAEMAFQRTMDGTKD